MGDNYRVFCNVHAAGRFVAPEPEMSGIYTLLYKGGLQRLWSPHNSNVRDAQWLLGELWEFNARRRDSHYFYEVIPTQGCLRQIIPIQDDNDAINLAELGRSTSFINIYVTSGGVDAAWHPVLEERSNVSYGNV